MTATVVSTVLNHENYKDWSFRMKTYFLADDLWDVVEGIVKEPLEGEESKAWKKKDAKALYAIQNSCGDDTYKFIKDKTTAKEAWDTLSENLKKRDENPSDENVLEEMSVLQAYPTPTPTEDVTRPERSMKERHTGGLRLPFLTFRASKRPERHGMVPKSTSGELENFANYVESNDWDNAIKLLGRCSQLGSCTFRYASDGTALHYAIQKRCSVRNIRRLVESMEMKHMEIQDKDGFTALYTLIFFYPGRVEVAECMVKKNHNLLTIMPDRLKVLPVVLAQRDPQMGRMARSLYFLTQHETLKVPVAAHLISLDFCYHRFDIAWDLIQRYPKLAMAEDYMGNFPLITLARNPSASKVQSRLNLWEKLIYYGCQISEWIFENPTQLRPVLLKDFLMDDLSTMASPRAVVDLFVLPALT